MLAANWREPATAGLAPVPTTGPFPAKACAMSQDNWNQDFGSQDSSGPPPKQGMGTGMKVFLILLAFAGVCCLVCCGGIYYFVSKFKGENSTDPAKVAAALADIAKIDLPPGFKPAQMTKVDVVAFGFTTVEYKDPAVDGEFMLMEMGIKVGGPRDEDQLRQQFENRETGHLRGKLKSETKMLKVKGRDCPFEFIEQEDPATKKKYRQVTGAFDGKAGPTMLMLKMEEKAFKQDQVVKIIEGIQ